MPHEICICPSPVLSMQYQFVHFNEVMMRVLLYTCATRGGFLPFTWASTLLFLLLMHLQKLIVNKFGMCSLVYPFHASDIGVWHSPVFDLHTKHTWIFIHETAHCFMSQVTWSYVFGRHNLQNVLMCWLTLWARV